MSSARCNTLFTDFQSITKNLTEVEISVKVNWLCNLRTVHLSVTTKLFIQAAGHYHVSPLLPMVKINAPLLETGHFIWLTLIALILLPELSSHLSNISPS